MHVLPFAVSSPFRPEELPVLAVQKRVEGLDSEKDYVAAFSSVSAVRTAFRHICLSAETETTVTAVAGDNRDTGLIYEFQGDVGGGCGRGIRRANSGSPRGVGLPETTTRSADPKSPSPATLPPGSDRTGIGERDEGEIIYSAAGTIVTRLRLRSLRSNFTIPSIFAKRV